MKDIVVLHELIKQYSVQKKPEGEFFTLASGKQSSYYIDLKKTLLMASGSYAVGNILYSHIVQDFFEASYVAGVALGGCSLATAVSMCSVIDHKEFGNEKKLDTLYVRKDSKEHGTKNLIEGSFELGSKVVLLEDVVTTGQSSKKAIDILERSGLIVIGIIAVLDREEGGADLFADMGISFRSIFRVQDVL